MGEKKAWPWHTSIFPFPSWLLVNKRAGQLQQLTALLQAHWRGKIPFWVRYGNFSETWQCSKVHLFGPHRGKQQLKSYLGPYQTGSYYVHKMQRKRILSPVKLHLRAKATCQGPLWIKILFTKSPGTQSLSALSWGTQAQKQLYDHIFLPSCLREEKEGIMCDGSPAEGPSVPLVDGRTAFCVATWEEALLWAGLFYLASCNATRAFSCMPSHLTERIVQK